METKRERGRPFKSDAARKSAELRIRLTKEERTVLDAAADGHTSTWAREILLEEARREQSRKKS
jgi:uncharacterized protein (DUF1778 family)